MPCFRFTIFFVHCITVCIAKQMHGKMTNDNCHTPREQLDENALIWQLNWMKREHVNCAIPIKNSTLYLPLFSPKPHSILLTFIRMYDLSLGFLLTISLSLHRTISTKGSTDFYFISSSIRNLNNLIIRFICAYVCLFVCVSQQMDFC